MLAQTMVRPRTISATPKMVILSGLKLRILGPFVGRRVITD
jgi:hypothetical protein